MRLAARLIVLEANLANRRAARERRRRLQRELSCFLTPAERRDLLARLDRYPDSATGELRELLLRGAVRSGVEAWPAMQAARHRT
jgi:hypothetical protein